MNKYELNYVKNNIKKLEHIEGDNEDVANKLSLLKKVNINVIDYNKLNLRENGVEFIKINEELLHLIKKLSKYDFSKKEKVNNDVQKIQNELELKVNKFLFNFLKSKSTKGTKNFSDNFTDIIIVESAIRTSKIKKFDLTDSKTNATATWLHTDWWEGQDFTSMIVSRFNWLDKLKKFAPKKYTDIKNINDWPCFWNSKYVDLINIWIPFSETTETCPLAFCDLNNTNYNDIIPYTYKVKYGKNKEHYYYEIATRLRYNKDQKIYSKQNMKIGEAIVFKANKTPHTAYYTDKNNVQRKSIEFRCIVLNFDRYKADLELEELHKNI